MVTADGVPGQAAGADLERLRRTLGDPALARLVQRITRRLELGRPPDADLTLTAATEEERLALSRLLGRRVSLRGRSLRVPVAQLEQALARAGIAPDLAAAVEALSGPITPRPEAAAAERARREGVRAVIAAGRHAGQSWYERWAESLAADGTVTRLIRTGGDLLIRQAVAVMDRLPADAVPLPALAEQTTGDTKALTGTPLARLVLRALALRDDGAGGLASLGKRDDGAGGLVGLGKRDDGAGGLVGLGRRETQRALWESAGVIPDDLASQVLVLGLAAAPSSPLGRWLADAATAGVPFRVTLHQLVTMTLTPTAGEVFVCENPSVLRAAVPGAGAKAVPPGDGRRPGRTGALVCTEGIPSAACHRLLTACARAGAVIRWRGDFDWTGLRTVTAAIDRYGALPWRMGLGDYDAALATGVTEPLRGPAASSPWDPPLAGRMRLTGQAVMEERLIPSLLRDLRTAW